MRVRIRTKKGSKMNEPDGARRKTTDRGDSGEDAAHPYIKEAGELLSTTRFLRSMPLGKRAAYRSSAIMVEPLAAGMNANVPSETYRL